MSIISKVINVTLDKAKELYNSGNETLKELALKAFTEKEIELFKAKGMRVETIAGNFAAKEALSKALGTGFRGYSLQDFEILRDQLGKPIVNISKKAREEIGGRVLNINVSISHNKSNAIAFAIVEE